MYYFESEDYDVAAIAAAMMEEQGEQSPCFEA